MLLVASDTISSYSVHATYPPLSPVGYISSSSPPALSPPLSDNTFARPFSIDPELYESLLHVAIPITIAIVYATIVTYVNKINKERENKPWGISQTLTFYVFVVLHNVFLAVYSAWTFFGLLHAFRQSWPGFNGEYGLAGAADALCKINGPRGLGSAATYNASANGWTFTDRAMRLLDNRPDPSDVGRIWNEGLAFYGWLFYLSKFYEVMDTAIVFAKGKNTSFLQIYHHAGAMICTWAGMRYMSPPIWMFVLVNSGIHSLMYTYYALAALTVQVPPIVKRTLTTLQIVQIIWGITYAVAHLFVAYEIPIEYPYLYLHNLSTAIPTAASTLSSALASVTASANFADWLKKAALRAAGAEGLAENVRNNKGETFGIDAVHHAKVEKAQEEIRYRMGKQTVHCLDTSGQVFAILLNALYLAPLAYLFAKFFYHSYIARENSEPPKPTIQENAKMSAEDAVKAVERKIEEAMKDQQGGKTEPPSKLKAELEEVKSNAKQAVKDFNEKLQKGTKDMSDKANKGAKDLGAKAQQGAQDMKAKTKDATNHYSEKAKHGAEDMAVKEEEEAKKGEEAVKDQAETLKDNAANTKDAEKDKTQASMDKAADAKDPAKEGANDAKQNSEDQFQASKDKVAPKKQSERSQSRGGNGTKKDNVVKKEDARAEGKEYENHSLEDGDIAQAKKEEKK